MEGQVQAGDGCVSLCQAPAVLPEGASLCPSAAPQRHPICSPTIHVHTCKERVGNVLPRGNRTGGLLGCLVFCRSKGVCRHLFASFPQTAWGRLGVGLWESCPCKAEQGLQVHASPEKLSHHGVILVEARVSWGFGPQEDHGYPMYQRACLLSCPSFHENETDH